MSTLVAEPPPRRFSDMEDRERCSRRTPTLADVVAAAWEGLCSVGAAICPVCGGTLAARRAGARAGEVSGGHCLDCGSTLS